MPMNEIQTLPSESGGCGVALLLLLGMAFWCWFSSGPYFLRWPLVVLIVLITSGHSLGGVVANVIAPLAGPILTLLIMFAGLMIMIRGFGGRSRRRYYGDDWRRGGRYDDRW